MNVIDNVKSFWAYVVAFLAGLILWIDPSHIDKLIADHPKWAGVILFLWTAILSWAQKRKPAQPVPPDMNQAGRNPIARGGTR